MNLKKGKKVKQKQQLEHTEKKIEGKYHWYIFVIRSPICVLCRWWVFWWQRLLTCENQINISSLVELLFLIFILGSLNHGQKMCVLHFFSLKRAQSKRGTKSEWTEEQRRRRRRRRQRKGSSRKKVTFHRIKIVTREKRQRWRRWHETWSYANKLKLNVKKRRVLVYVVRYFFVHSFFSLQIFFYFFLKQRPICVI